MGRGDSCGLCERIVWKINVHMCFFVCVIFEIRSIHIKNKFSKFLDDTNNIDLDHKHKYTKIDEYFLLTTFNIT